VKEYSIGCSDGNLIIDGSKSKGIYDKLEWKFDGSALNSQLEGIFTV